MPYGVQFDQHGGPEVLEYREIPKPQPGPGQVLVRLRAAGLNYIDTYHRSGYYPLPSLPSGLGVEGAGIVDGSDRRVAFVTNAVGCYQQYHVVPESQLVDLPDDISFEQAAGMLLKAMTVRFLLKETVSVGPSHTVLVHAAAGGVGLILCQWAAALGARVIGTVGSDAKAELARQHGCSETILYDVEPVSERVRELTGGQGVDVVYDSVGKASFSESIKSLRPRGMLVAFGQSSGPVEAFDPVLLSRHGSLFLTRPTLFNYIDTPQSLKENSQDCFSMVRNGTVSIPVRQTWHLSEAADAHTALQQRKTVGSSVLIVD